MSKQMIDQTLAEIEKTQVTLRECIEQSKRLAEHSDQLIQLQKNRPSRGIGRTPAKLAREG